MSVFSSLQKPGRIIRQIKDAINDWIWSQETAAGKGAFVARKAAQFALLSGYGIRDNRIFVHASALTYTTVLSLLPFVAVLLWILTMTELWDIGAMQEAVSERFSEFSPLTEPLFDLLSQTDFGSLGLAGIIFLFTTVFSMMGKIERAFNEIWDVRKARSPFRKALDYSLILISTSIMISAGWVMQAMSSRFIGRYLDLDMSWMFPLFTYLFTSLGLTMLNRLMPKLHVPWMAAALGGFAGGLGYMLMSKAYFGLQIGMANYNLVYSSIAALPITIIWIDIAWIIVLVCAQLSCTMANFSSFQRRALGRIIAAGLVEETAIRLALKLARLSRDEPGSAWTAEELADRMNLPFGLTHSLLLMLAGDGRIDRPKANRFSLGDKLADETRLSDVLSTVVQRGEATEGEPDERLVFDYFRSIDLIARDNPANLSLGEALESIDGKTI